MHNSFESRLQGPVLLLNTSCRLLAHEVEETLFQKVCSRCKNTAFRRLGRYGPVERYLLAWAGLYPWECVMCRRKTYLRDEGRKPSERGHIV